jgi:hypothetical protein
MEVLKAALASILVAGCYAPEIHDCTVQCASAGDCAPGQMCGTDGMCAAPAMAGHCLATGTHDDAGIADASDAHDATDAHDAPVDAKPAPPDAKPDAQPPPDASTTIQLHIKIDGQGSVLMGGQTCDSAPPAHGDCMFAAQPGMTVTLLAVPHAMWMFEKWSGALCGGQNASCTATPVGPALIQVKFKKQHEGDD